MCGIAGFVCFKKDFKEQDQKWREIAKDMGETLSHRGPDARGEWVGENTVFAHTRLAVIDIEGGAQPMKKTVGGNEYTIVYNGELYNTKELKRELIKLGYSFDTTSDTEVLLTSYIQFGKSAVHLLNGIFSFAIWDSGRKELFGCRDRFGVKPLFYTLRDDTLIFASEIKALLKFPGIKPKISREGLCEVFGLGPARTPGCGVFKDIMEIRPGYIFSFTEQEGFKSHEYFEIKSHLHTDSYEDTVENVRYLLKDSIRRQLVSDVPICTFLSGGLDSSIITAVAAEHIKEMKGKMLSTYSFDYVDNDKYFKSSSYQPDNDRPWVDKMVQEFQTEHTYLYCDTDDLVENLYTAVRYKDLPGMADVDSSLLHFCSQVKKNHVVALSGECADEIFGGYPWFHSKEAFNTAAFPWSPHLGIRKSVISEDVLKQLDLDSYVGSIYDLYINKTPEFGMDTPEEERRRQIAYLNLYWFMATLLDRKDRMSMASGLEVRVPFCDHRLVQYVFNIPWDQKAAGGVRKSILREAAKDILPRDVLERKKSPYPKTHNPGYERAVKERLLETIADPNAPIKALIDKKEVEKLCKSASDYGRPWFGQLMAEPQLAAYLLQINYWLSHYGIEIC